MKRLIWPVLFLLLYLIQAAVSVFYTGWLGCDLVMLGVYAYAILRGASAGAAVGLGVGLLQDAMTVGLFGYHMLTRAALGFFVGLTKGKVVRENKFYHMTAIMLCTLAVRFGLFIMALLRNGGQVSIFGSFINETFGMIIGNMLLVMPVLRLVKYVYDWIKEDDITY